MASSEMPVDKWRHMTRNFQTLSVESAAEVISEDCVIHEAAGMPQPVAGEWHGPKGFVDLMAAMQATFSDFGFVPDKVVSNEDIVAFTGRVSGSLPGGRFDIPIIEFWTFKDGKAVDILPVWHDTKLISSLYTGASA